MCAICDGQSYREYFADMRRKISQFGWAVQGVEGAVDEDGIHPAFAYTVGLTRHDLPEILITGRPMDEACRALNELAGLTRRGGRLAVESRICVLGLEVFFLPIVHRCDWMPTVYELYPGRRVTALQAVWADGDGNLPWEQEHPDVLTQPLICEPPSFFP